MGLNKPGSREHGAKKASTTEPIFLQREVFVVFFVLFKFPW